MLSALTAFALLAGATDTETLARSFSAELVGALTPVKPVAGRWAMSLELDYEEFITMELRVTERRRGALELSLDAAGTARACAALRTTRSTSGQYHYEPPERRQGTRSEESVQLLALAGRWQVEGGVAMIVFDRVAWSTCDVGSAAVLPEPYARLRCVAVSPTKLLPAAGLACDGRLLELGVPLGADAKAERGQAPRGTQLLLGVPGLQVQYEQSRGAAPKLVLRAGPVTLAEKDWQPRPAKTK